MPSHHETTSHQVPRPPTVSSTEEASIPTRPTNRRSTSEQCRPEEHSPSKTCALDQLTWPVKLLRKEVIQPHLPVRLPCYDFVPIARPTFDGSLHKG